MADKPKTTTAATGRTWKGQEFPPVRTEEDVKEQADLQRQYDKEGAITLDVYFAQKGIRNPVQHAGMRAYTKITRATVEDWDAIFEKF